MFINYALIKELRDAVSVPIRGLFNLTLNRTQLAYRGLKVWFPSPLGDYLI